MKRFFLVLTLLVFIVPVMAQEEETVDLSGIKEYAAEHAALMAENSAAFLETVQTYYDLLAGYDFDYEAAYEAEGETLAELVMTARENWLQTSLYYELNEGIVAGTPSLAYYDVLIDAGASAEDDPEEALEWTLTLPDGTELESPGNLFHSLSEPTLYGTVDEFVGAEADLDGDGEVGPTEVLPDANLLLGVTQRLDEETQNLVTAIDEWEPTEEDAFTALVVMIPTMSEYFGQWKESAFVAGDEASEVSFVAASRLLDIVSILTGLRVTYDTVSPLVAESNPDLDAQIVTSFDDLQAYVDDLYEDEQEGVVFEAEEVDLLGTEAQDRAESLAALVAQAADTLGITLELE
ncbi:EfeM/EfeO family lipoprotein [Phototrophicus methaneseepsis]|uniref:EfeM/EfeO family lipoprotein n=1 Tax=Phototrophicus methaneseepsis TaxID=2710758 RepID=A0A7S8ECK8_9CHLR|nr:imelysin family protein [Phototrophicus methaneseepsis]QPC84471.1 EfeM/EfeO family lipoprotein [Phototrophicus methaneseepsis]